MNDVRSLARESDAWPFVEARRILDRIGGAAPAKGHVLLETGYGPSGLPHIGTFAEVARTTMILRAFRMLSDVPARLVCFSDDMDGLRKVPDNVPNRELLAQHLGKPLTVGARPVRHPPELRPAQQRAAARVPRPVRVRVRVPVGHRLLSQRTVRRCTARGVASP